MQEIQQFEAATPLPYIDYPSIIDIYADIVRDVKCVMPNLKNIIPFALFGIKTFIAPDLSFTNYDCSNTKWSYGENIRVIANSID